jgi:hypothetical protein
MYDSCHTSLSSHACSVHPDVISTQRDIDGLQKEVDSEDGTADRLRQLTQAKGDLANAEEKYSAEHPDVIRLKHLVETLEKAVQDDANATPVARVKTGTGTRIRGGRCATEHGHHS